MNKDELKAALATKGWVEDRFGHMKKTLQVTIDGVTTPRIYRVKFQALSVRLERQYHVEREYSGKLSEWSLVSSSYFKDINVTINGGIVIGMRVIK